MAAGGGREVIDTLIEALRDNHRDPALLNAAIAALAQTSTDGAMAVIPLLDSDDADVRTYASLALGLIGRSAGRARAPRSARRRRCQRSVSRDRGAGPIGDRAAADAVVAVAEQRDFFLAFPALDALAAIGDPSIAPRVMALLDDEPLLPAVVACLGALGAEDVVAGIAALTSAPGAAVLPAARALAAVYDRAERTMSGGALIADLARGAMTPASATTLIAALRGASVDELRALAVVLSWLPSDEIDRELAALLRNDGVRETVGECLASRGATAVPHVERMLAEENAPDVRRVAALVLGRIGCPTSSSALIAMLTDSDSGVMRAAAGALGAIGEKRAFPQLLELMDHEDAIVRQTVVAALNSIGHPKMEAAVSKDLSDSSPRRRESAARIAGYFGYESCLRQIVDLCDDEDPVVRRAAVESLANFDRRPAWSKVTDVVVSDDDATVRASAVRALGQQRNDDAVPALIRALCDPNLWVRYYAARACMRRSAMVADVVAALLECAIRDGVPPVRIAAIDTLGALQVPSTIDIIIVLVHDADADVAIAAIQALGRFDIARSTQTLELSLDDADSRRQLAALDALAQHRSSAVPAVGSIVALALATRDDAVRVRATHALVEIGGGAAMNALSYLADHHRFAELVTGAVAQLREECLSDLERELEVASDGARAVLIDGLGRTTLPGASRILAAALEDSSARVRWAAATGLMRRDLRDARSRARGHAHQAASAQARFIAHDDRQRE